MYDLNLNEIPVPVWAVVVTFLGILLGNLVTLISISLSYRTSLKNLSSGPFQELFKVRLVVLKELIKLWANHHEVYSKNLLRLTNKELEKETIDQYFEKLDFFIENYKDVETSLRSYYSSEIEAGLNILNFIINDFQTYALNEIEDNGFIPEDEVLSHIENVEDYLKRLIDSTKSECGIKIVTTQIEKSISGRRLSNRLRSIYKKVRSKFLLWKDDPSKYREYVSERQREIDDFKKKRAKGETNI